MPDKNTDLGYLNQTLELAKIRRGFCAPNPSVGSVITLNNKILATGYHLAAGSPHAEVDALQKLSMRAEGATIYISLVPCCHFGRTPPCTDAIINAGIKRVVYSHPDSNPEVMGKSAELLRAKGISCDHIPLAETSAFYESYDHWRKTKTPFVTAKIALTLDGKIAGKKGEPIQITGQPLQQLTHSYRKAADAILTTVKTIIHDDPQFNVRLADETIAKPLYILDSNLNLPLTAKIFKTTKSMTLFHDQAADPARKQALIKQGVRCISIDTHEYGLDLKKVIESIGQDGIHDLWIEAGGQCFAALTQQKLIQRAFIYLAPRWLGDGQAAFEKTFSFDFSTAQIHWKQVGKDALCEIRW